jgi:hypothetical protein
MFPGDRNCRSWPAFVDAPVILVAACPVLIRAAFNAFRVFHNSLFCAAFSLLRSSFCGCSCSWLVLVDDRPRFSQFLSSHHGDFPTCFFVGPVLPIFAHATGECPARNGTKPITHQRWFSEKTSRIDVDCSSCFILRPMRNFRLYFCLCIIMLDKADFCTRMMFMQLDSESSHTSFSSTAALCT